MSTQFLESRKILRILIPLAVCAFLLSSASIAQAAETEILILHTNNVTGYLLPCPT